MKWALLRSYLQTTLFSPTAERSVTALVFLNIFILAAATYPGWQEATSLRLGISTPEWLECINRAFIVLFCVETALRSLVLGRGLRKDPWTIFDVSVVWLSVIFEIFGISAVRSLRVLRSARLLSRLHPLRFIADIFARSIVACFWISCLMLIALVAFSIVAHNLYGQSNPELFGNLHLALYTLFRVAACFSLHEVYSELAPAHPYANVFLIPYFIVMGFGLMNYFGAIITILLWEFSFSEILRSGRRDP
jgi:voltage-gated sodium channel